MDAVFVVLAVGALLGYAAAAAWVFESGTPVAASIRQSMRRPSAWVVAVVVAFAALALGVPWVYTQTTDDAPAPLAFGDEVETVDQVSTTSTSSRAGPAVTRPGSRTTVTIVNPSLTVPPPTTPVRDGRGGDSDGDSDGDGDGEPVDNTTTSSTVGSAIAGAWTVGPGSVAGYRADELLVLQRKETAGRTSNVTGTMVVEGLTVREVTATVDMASISSDNPQRDEQYRGRIMDVAHYPTSEFRLTEPIELDGVPAAGEVVQLPATGEFTIRGVTRTVIFPLQARIHEGRIEVLAHIPVRWDEYGIPDPSTPLARVDDHGEIELLLLFDRTS